MMEDLLHYIFYIQNVVYYKDCRIFTMHMN